MTIERVLNVSRRITQMSYFGLLAVLLMNALAQGAPWVFYLWPLPLIIFIPGLLKERTRTLIWLCFVVLLYFYIAVDNLAGPNPTSLDYSELVLSVALFIAAMIWARCKQKMEILESSQQEP